MQKYANQKELRKILTGVCGPGFRNHTLGYGDQGPNHTLGYGKWVKIKPLTIGHITKLTTFEAILHKISQIWPNFCHLLGKNARIRSKWSKFAENIPLATEPQPKLDHWLRKLGSKTDPCGRHTPSKVHITSAPSGQNLPITGLVCNKQTFM